MHRTSSVQVTITAIYFLNCFKTAFEHSELCPYKQITPDKVFMAWHRFQIDKLFYREFKDCRKDDAAVEFTCTAPPKKRVVCYTMMRKDRIDMISPKTRWQA